MIRTYRNEATADIARGVKSSAARRLLPQSLHIGAQRKLAAVHVAGSIFDLNIPGYRLEKLRGNRQGQYSIRINRQYRICFQWQHGDAFDVEIIDYH